MTYVTYLFGFPVVIIPDPNHRVLAFIPRSGRRRRARINWHRACALAASAGPRRHDAPGFHHGFPAANSVIRDFGYRPGLTASTLWLRGAFYGFLAILHAITVIGALLYLPFGKFFHIFQRPAQLGVKLYQHAGEHDEGAHCARCGLRFASRMQIDDLKHVLPQLGFDYRIAGPAGTWQALCPACKRISYATAQLRIKEEVRG